ncbi:hypothetical protein B5S28_g4208 [[Candida] boidinii]|nr:hypothetical protein B5S28_g4208 [[Candida] boidinii]OWB61566.1 hypothetical protein B5S29_g2461 [[Candida] boidinii]OWB73116.1 hypothetical protein B5S31_g2848 [[Candida] boidinii]
MSFITNSWNKFRTYTAPEKMLVETYLTGKKLTYSVVALSALSIFFFGYDQGLMSGVNASPDYVDHMKFGYSLDDGTVIVTDSVKQGGIVAIYYFGTLWGALFGGIVSDDIGRIKSIALGAVIAIVGAALQCSAQQTAWMCGARFVNGLGTGVLNAVVPVYTSETAESTSRGAYLAIEFTLNIFGVVVAYWLEFGLSFIDGGFSAFRWRFPIAFQILFLLVLLAIVWFFPESPRWLVKNGDQARARSLLVKMRGEEDGDREFNEIVAALSYEEDSALSSNYLSMFFDWYRGSEEQVAKAKKLHIARRVQLCVWFQIIQEWIGIAGITVYQIDIFSQAGFDSRKSQWLSGLNNIFYMFSTLISVFTLDKWGRRFTCYWGAVGQGIALFLAGGFSKAQQNHPNNKSFGAAAAAFVFIYTSVFGATWLEVPWMYPAEVFPLEVRAQGNAWGVFGWSIGNGWLTLLCPVMFNSIHERTLYIFGGCNFLGIVLVYFFIPETANRSLEDIDFLFSSDSWLASKCEAEFIKLTAGRELPSNTIEDMKNDVDHVESVKADTSSNENVV